MFLEVQAATGKKMMVNIDTLACVVELEKGEAGAVFITGHVMQLGIPYSEARELIEAAEAAEDEAAGYAN